MNSETVNILVGTSVNASEFLRVRGGMSCGRISCGGEK